MIRMTIQEQLGSAYAFIFPGQGSQSVGMARDWAEHSAPARDLLTEADATLGFDLTRLMFEGPESDLADTRNSQPAIYVASMVALTLLNQKLERAGDEARPRMVAGHSLGEFSALVAAGVIDFATGLKLVAARGEFMAEAGNDRPGAMAAVLGMDDDVLADLVEQAAEGQVLTIANLNCPGQTVISGEEAPLERFMALAKDAGARRIARLPISIASHSALMEPAAEKLNALFDDVTLSPPAMPVVSNSTGQALTTVEEIREELRYHVVRGVDWTTSMRTMIDAGITTFLELGNGTVLAGLNKRIDKSIATIGLKELGIAD